MYQWRCDVDDCWLQERLSHEERGVNTHLQMMRPSSYSTACWRISTCRRGNATTMICISDFQNASHRVSVELRVIQSVVPARGVHVVCVNGYHSSLVVSSNTAGQDICIILERGGSRT